MHQASRGRGKVEEGEMEVWQTPHEKGRGDVGVEKERAKT